ncbi:hypothetical protein [Paractinoplanes durhamensis]|uniref:Uncharacterized protein n=1 Tax=Paractinoplanes durhamensis TaxID=113563 RepID=A0ABQ3YU68_9ACTN|nr:hypothetical protein [Actinoplanes durhamensis]GIE01101.1 hypothetical protein Adu01nite_24510 [Actinoplanes durhamensis]
MIRTGRSRVSALVAAVMLVLALGATVVVSAGSAHHAPEAASQVSVDVHEHGNDRAPRLSKRLRPATAVTLLSIVAPDPDPAPVPADFGEPVLFSIKITSSSVLRV